ncbi:MAG TPA: hypothetical protein VIH48_04870 [Candidatus Bathyarchaeia archaeon]
MKNDATSSSVKKALASRIFYDTAHGKNKELILLKGFLQRLCLKTCDIKESERPDFIVVLGKSSKHLKIGCEITLFYNEQNNRCGSLTRRFLEQWRRFSKELMAKMKEEGGGLEHLYGSVFFKVPSNKVLDKMDKDQFIRELTKLCKENFPKKAISLGKFDEDKYPLLRRTVQEISVKNIYPEKEIFWWPAHLQAGRVSDPSKFLVKIIKRKNKTAASYNWSGASEKWLVIVAEALALADMAILDDDISFKLFKRKNESMFSHVYLWDRFQDKVNELFPSHKTIFDSSERALYVNRLPKTVMPFLE